MTPQSIIILTTLAFIVGGIVGHVVGFSVGVRRGRDEAWIDNIIEAGRRDRARRNEKGQFKRRDA